MEVVPEDAEPVPRDDMAGMEDHNVETVEDDDDRDSDEETKEDEDECRVCRGPAEEG